MCVESAGVWQWVWRCTGDGVGGGSAPASLCPLCTDVWHEVEVESGVLGTATPRQAHGSPHRATRGWRMEGGWKMSSGPVSWQPTASLTPAPHRPAHTLPRPLAPCCSLGAGQVAGGGGGGGDPVRGQQQHPAQPRHGPGPAPGSLPRPAPARGWLVAAGHQRHAAMNIHEPPAELSSAGRAAGLGPGPATSPPPCQHLYCVAEV